MTAFQIHDLHLHPIKSQASAKVVLRDDDHLLRRFGQAEVRTLATGHPTDFTQRLAADELWAVIRGTVSFVLIDRRPASPTFDQLDNLTLSAKDEQALLIPFGVAYALEAEEAAQLLRLATHEDGTHDEDQHLPRQNFAERLAQA